MGTIDDMETVILATTVLIHTRATCSPPPPYTVLTPLYCAHLVSRVFCKEDRKYCAQLQHTSRPRILHEEDGDTVLVMFTLLYWVGWVGGYRWVGAQVAE